MFKVKQKESRKNLALKVAADEKNRTIRLADIVLIKGKPGWASVT